MIYRAVIKRSHGPSVFRVCNATDSNFRSIVCVMCLASERIPNRFSHGLRTPNEDFFHRNPKLFGLGRQFGQINFGAFEVLSVDLSDLFWCSESLVHGFH